MLPKSAWPTSQRSCLVSAAQPHLHIEASGRLRQGKGGRFPRSFMKMLKLTELVAFSLGTAYVPKTGRGKGSICD